MPSFIVTTLGCKVNQSESDGIAQQLKYAGWIPANGEKEPDLCIINTCTVTSKASLQSRQAVRQAIRANPGARILVTGCYAQTEPDEIKKIKGVHYLIGHAGKHQIPELTRLPDPPAIWRAGGGQVIAPSEKEPAWPVSIWKDISHEHDFNQTPVSVSGNKTRPFLKIQDGCDSYCTYCIVPYARGRSRSMLPENVFQNLEALKKAGYHEVVLTGVHLGSYGLDLRRPRTTSLTGLLNRIHESRIIDRVRLSSIDPHELNADIIKLVAASGGFCRHFHIPLQSGDDLILKRMHRPYRAALFRNLVEKIHKLIPDAAIGVDILIGFPGETDAAFKNTYSLIKELPVAYLHVFPFSPRKGTPAYKYSDQVPAAMIKTRCRQMRELGSVKKQEFYKKLSGKKVEVLLEGKRHAQTGLLKGLTPNYVPVLVKGEDSLKNTVVKVRIDKIDGSNAVFGTIC